MGTDVCSVVAYLTLAHTTIPLKKVDDVVSIRKLAYKNKNVDLWSGFTIRKTIIESIVMRIRNNTNHFERSISEQQCCGTGTGTGTVRTVTF
jgi:hypothetical protein